MPHRWRILLLSLLVLPVAVSAVLLAGALALGVSPAFDSLLGAFVVYFASRALAIRSGWPVKSARRVSLGGGVVTLFLPAVFWLLILLVFVVGCRGDNCFTF